MQQVEKQVWLTVRAGTQTHRWQVPAGTNLRQALLARGLSPYGRYTQRLNCGGRGLCATCGVRMRGQTPAPTHWHDRAAAAFGYPRLSCQVVVQADLEIALIPDKRLWGQWLPRKKPQGE